MDDADGSGRAVIPAGRWVFLAVLLPTAVGCGLGIDVIEDPTTARVVVDEDGETGPLLMVTSNDFTVFANPGSDSQDVRLDRADTAVVEAPVDRSFDLGPRVRFLAEVQPADDRETTLRMQVRINGRERFDRTATVTEGTPIVFFFTSVSN